MSDHRFSFPTNGYLSFIKHERSITQILHRRHLVTHKQHRAPPLSHLAHLAQALLLELSVADREDLVDEEDLGFEVGGDGEGQADAHAAGVALDGGVDKLLDAGEGDDLVELAVDLGFAHAEDGAVEVDVVAPGQLGMEAGADLEQAGDATAQLDPAGGKVGQTFFTFQDGLAADHVTALLRDDRSLWVGTPVGLSRYTLEGREGGLTWRTFGSNDGMAADAVSTTRL